jgi:hypothetical protein
MAEVRLTLEEYEALRRMISSERESEGASLSQRTPSPGSRPKKRKKNPKLKKALILANRKLRLNNGKLRKGKTQGDVMKTAHRLMKKMK